MKLQQLRYIVEVANNQLNISLASEKLFTSQPGVSKQIKLLEDELGITIFERNGKHLSKITAVGEEILKLSESILKQVEDIQILAKEVSTPNIGFLSVSASNMQARYLLPDVIQQFVKTYPQIELKLSEYSAEESLIHLSNKEIDFAIISDLSTLKQNMLALPCYHWNKSIVVKKSHPLVKKKKLTWDDIIQYPIICYDLSVETRDSSDLFFDNEVTPNIVLKTSDAELVKTYVKLDVGIGLIANMAIAPLDKDLVAINIGHLLSYSTTYIVFLKTLSLRQYMFDFITQFSSHLSKNVVCQALSCESHEAVLRLFSGIKLPIN